MSSLLAQATEVEFVRPVIDWHAGAPELVLLAWGALVTLVDIIWLEKSRRFIPTITGFGFLAALVPIITMWSQKDTLPRAMFDGAYVTDEYALVLKALFLVVGYVLVLMASNYMFEGDYYDAEFYQLISASMLGMLVMVSARDLITIFIALELVSIPAYLMAAWRKRDLKSNEAGLKYMLMGVFASAILLYGMSLIYGVTGSTRLSSINTSLAAQGAPAIVVLGVVFVIIGFGFKVSAVPFHTWAPDTYEGAPTPLTAFLAVASKTAGFVGLLSLVFIAFASQSEVIEPMMWLLAAVTMTVGNLLALRQSNVVRMLAYSGIAQAGYMLAPLAVYSANPDLSRSAIVNYLLIYAAMNLGAFAVVIVAARKTRSGELASFGGMFKYAPGLTVAMTVFLFSLAGLPPVGGWLAKWRIFESLLFTPVGSSIGWQGAVLAVVVAVNSVIAAYYYLNIAKHMWFMPVANGDNSPIKIPAALKVALAITVTVTVVSGVTNLMPGLSVYELWQG